MALDIIPDTIVPDFRDIDMHDPDQLGYAILFLALFEDLYKTYSTKDLDYIVKNIDKDVKEINRQMKDNTEELKKIFTDTRDSILTEKGILPENIGKTGIKESSIKYLLREQKQTIDNICNEFIGQIKSKAYYLLDRSSEGLFNINSNFTRAINRIKSMADSGVSNSKSKADSKATSFLYGDVYVNWVCVHDYKTCSFCLANEANSPILLSECPPCPAHANCRCTVEVIGDPKLTDKAEELMYYDI